MKQILLMPRTYFKIKVLFAVIYTESTIDRLFEKEGNYKMQLKAVFSDGSIEVRDIYVTVTKSDLVPNPANQPPVVLAEVDSMQVVSGNTVYHGKSFESYRVLYIGR